MRFKTARLLEADITPQCYGDDTELQISFKMRDCPTAANDLKKSDLLLIRNWCFNIFLLLNPDKTKLIVFGSRQLLAKLPDFKISLLGKVALASSAKYLGVVLDPQLTFDDHVLKTTSSCVSSLAQISRVKPRGGGGGGGNPW